MLSFALENEDEKLAYPTMVIGILWTVGGSSGQMIIFLNFKSPDVPDSRKFFEISSPGLRGLA